VPAGKQSRLDRGEVQALAASGWTVRERTRGRRLLKPNHGDSGAF
jgi:hypothetical protein